MIDQTRRWILIFFFIFYGTNSQSILTTFPYSVVDGFTICIIITFCGFNQSMYALTIFSIFVLSDVYCRDDLHNIISQIIHSKNFQWLSQFCVWINRMCDFFFEGRSKCCWRQMWNYSLTTWCSRAQEIGQYRLIQAKLTSAHWKVNKINPFLVGPPCLNKVQTHRIVAVFLGVS